MSLSTLSFFGTALSSTEDSQSVLMVLQRFFSPFCLSIAYLIFARSMRSIYLANSLMLHQQIISNASTFQSFVLDIWYEWGEKPLICVYFSLYFFLLFAWELWHYFQRIFRMKLNYIAKFRKFIASNHVCINIRPKHTSANWISVFETKLVFLLLTKSTEPTSSIPLCSKSNIILWRQ